MSNEGLLSARIAFLGSGNMAEAILKGIVDGGLCPAEHIISTDVRKERRDLFLEKYGVEVMEDNMRAVENADIVFLAVKPQDLGGLLDTVREVVHTERTMFLSIAAGIPTTFIEARLGGDTRVIRAMPNTPALIGDCAAAICAGQYARETDLDNAQALLEGVGFVVRVDEKHMNAVTAVSGSGPAYVFFLIEAMEKAAKALGLNEKVARSLILTTVAGAARLCDETGLDASELRARVTSKGGTTAAAFEVLNHEGVESAFIDAIAAAYRRAKELEG